MHCTESALPSQARARALRASCTWRVLLALAVSKHTTGRLKIAHHHDHSRFVPGRAELLIGRCAPVVEAHALSVQLRRFRSA